MGEGGVPELIKSLTCRPPTRPLRLRDRRDYPCRHDRCGRPGKEEPELFGPFHSPGVTGDPRVSDKNEPDERTDKERCAEDVAGTLMGQEQETPKSTSGRYDLDDAARGNENKKEVVYG
jgi:hypothetical protein